MENSAADTRANLVSFVEHNAAPHWHIHSLSTNARVFDSGTDEGLTMDVSVERLQRAFDMLPNGNYRLYATRIQKATVDTAKAKAAQSYVMPFEKSKAAIEGIGALPPLPNYYQPPAPVVDVEERLSSLAQKMSLEFELRDHKRQLEDAKTRIRDLEKEVDKPDAIGGFLKALEPHVGTIVKAVTPPSAAAVAAPAANIAGTRQVDISASEAEALQNSFDLLATVVPNVPDFVHALARKAQENPEQFKQYLPFILNGKN
jgi:hypothetical protein